LTALRARGNNDRRDEISKVNTVTLLPSSYISALFLSLDLLGQDFVRTISGERNVGGFSEVERERERERERTLFVPSQIAHSPSRSMFF
jgi:hypothetical protein